MDNKPPNITLIDDTVWVIDQPIGMAQYDFRFEDHFVCKHPYQLDSEITAIARMGAANDYAKRYEKMENWGIKLIHTPEEYDLTSYLPNWYPLIEKFTPKSIWYEKPPSVKEIENEFDWPIFVKGERQTSKHSRHKSIIESPEHYLELIEIWKRDKILHWQKMVCREFIPLEPVAKTDPDIFPKSYEFRSFWWKNSCVGIGPYWFSENYKLDTRHEEEVIKIGSEVAELLNVKFLVIDIAYTKNGEWIVIECNDGQDSGYAGNNPRFLWNNILNIEKEEL
ncbi:MAG: ATP-grasp domain-containing protein [Desulfobacterales bacterium]|nr:ATP-grasp domain-containing protein [Desulfobacterales bacterium]MCP4161351.1 ATP-grasp domain-containing protein [Deltaproteobacteria bacterium]